MKRHNIVVLIFGCWILHYLIYITVISQSEAYTWFEAQAICTEKNQSLTLRNNESSSFYWTGSYMKISLWIKFIGCYGETEIQHGQMDILRLSKSSPPLCQDYCYQKNILLFAVQAEKCICLSGSFDFSKNQLAPSMCKYRCEESRLLSTECGGGSAFNVFLTDISELKVPSRCLSFKCGGNPMFMDFQCSTSLPTICRALANKSHIGTWMEGKDYCKGEMTYPMGNLNLSDIKLTCAETKGTGSASHWLGVFKEMYEKEDQGQLITTAGQTVIKQCMKCLFDESYPLPDCQYVFCNVNLTSAVFCSKKDKTTQQPQDTDTNYSETTTRIDSTSMHETTSNASIDLKITESKESAIITVPVVIIILLLSVLAAAIVMYIRKKKSIQDSTGGIGPLITGSTNYSNVQNQRDKNYSIPQQSNFSYELAGHIIVESESPYNEAEDGTYDHLGNKDARKKCEDIYNHSYGAELSDMSDYDVVNRKRFNEENRTYDDAGVTDNSYGH